MIADTQKRRDQLFAALLAICITLLILLLCLSYVSKDLGPLSQAHPQFEQILNSTTADDALPRPLLYIVPILLFGVFGTVLLIAYTRKRSNSRPSIVIVSYMMGYVFLLSMMFLTHDANSSSYFGGFPAATAWMTYGIWFFPLLFITLYFFRFEDWVLDENEQEIFEDLVLENSKEE